MYTRLFAEGEGSDKTKTAAAPQGDKTVVEVGVEQQPIMIPKARLDEVLEKNRVLLEKQTKRDEADAKHQKEEDEKAGNFKKLADEADQRAKASDIRLSEAQRYNLFLQEASKAGIVDLPVAYTALPVVAEGEKMDELVAKLVESKPYFVMQVEIKNGVPVIKSGGGQKPPRVDAKVALEVAYADAMKNHKTELAMQIKRQITELAPKP